MAIKIRFVDAATDQTLGETIVDDDEIKALSTDMISTIKPDVVFMDFVVLNIHNKVRRVIDKLCEEALGAGSERIEPLTTPQKQVIADSLAASGDVLVSVAAMRPQLKRQIVSMAKVKTAAERQAEFEAGLP